MKKFKKIDSVDKDVALPLADIMNTAFRDGMSDDMYNELTKNINRPGDCVSLKETRVNQGVWSVLKPYTQTDDSKLRGVQNEVVKATIKVTKMMDAGASTFYQKLMDWGVDAIAILGQANKWLNVRRKDMYKKDMTLNYIICVHHHFSLLINYMEIPLLKIIKTVKSSTKSAGRLE